MTSPPPPGPGPNADALANTARIAAEQAVASQVGQVATFLAGGGLADAAVDDLSWQVNRLAEIARLRRQLALSSLDAQKAATAQIPAMLGSVAQEAAGGLDVQLGGLADELVSALTAMWDRTPALLSGAAQTIVSNATAQVRVGNLTRVQATAQAADRLVAQGISPALDRAGRRWTAPAYTEMKIRTSVMDAARTGRETQAQRFGTPYMLVSDALRECPRCAPFEHQVLSLDGTDPDGIAKTTVAEARAAGLFHPNAILGDQAAESLGLTENAVRAHYVGPSVHLTSAKGHRLSVSPNHPVLTSRGWLRADLVREGDEIFSRSRTERVGERTEPVHHFNHPPATFQQELDALTSSGLVMKTAATALDFHGDGRFYKGEIHVVWAESALRDVVQASLVEQFSERSLIGAGMQAEALAGDGSRFSCGHRVGGPIAGTLPNFHAPALESSAQGRIADAEDPRQVLAGLACGVTADKVVHVERDWFDGHAYDLQTSTGAYLASSILVHNCRHMMAPFFPEYSTIPEPPSRDPNGYEASVRQRELERRVRREKLRQQTAETIDPGGMTAQAAKTRVREAQRQLREHVKATGQRRRPDRERVPAAS